MPAKTYTVAVFTHPGKRGPRYHAYTRVYNPQWKGCCLHEVRAWTGAEAKRLAILGHKKKCVAALEDK